MLGSTPVQSPRRSSRPALTPWELPRLLTPMHRYKAGKGKRGVERAHYPAILAFVHRNRFAVASQIQRRFSDILRSDRTTRRHLEELESLGYLAVAPARGTSPLFPKVYHVRSRGVRKLRNSLEARGKTWNAVHVDRSGRRKNEGYGAEHIIHEILITEFLLALWQTTHGRSDLELLTVQRRSVAKHSSFEVTLGSRRSRLVPDAMFMFRQKGGGMSCCFLELDNGTMNAKQLRAKYSRYAVWAESPLGRQFLLDLYQRHGAKEPRTMFRILLVARSRTGMDDDGRVAELLTAADHAPAGVRDRLWITTVASLASHQQHAVPLEHKLWIRGRDIAWSSGVIAKDQIRNSAKHALIAQIAHK